MPDTVELGQHADSQVDSATLSGTKLYSALGTATGKAVAEAAKTAKEWGDMGIKPSWMQSYGNMSAMLVLSVGAALAFMWLRNDSKDSRDEYRQQVIRQEQLSEERRREERLDGQRRDDLYQKSLDNILRDSRETTTQMRIVTEQVKSASEQMKIASEAMGRVEKAITSKGSIP